MTEPLSPEREAHIKQHANESRDVSAVHIAELFAELDRVRAQLATYVGVEPTIAEEMAYLSRCLDAVYEVCDQSKRDGALGPTVEAVEKAADGERPDRLTEQVVEFGVRLYGDTGATLESTIRAAVERNLALLRDTYPNAVLVQRTARYGTWTEVTS